MTADHPERLRTYGRIRGRSLRPGRADLLDSYLPEVSLDVSAGTIDPGRLMPGASAVWLELGFGAGEHLAAQAQAHPDALLLGAEPFLNGAASALRHVRDQGLGNVRIHAGDGRELMAALPDASIARVFVLFPDPWPKTRHKKRRLINDETVAELARVMTPAGTVRFCTDWADYIGWTLERFARSGAFEWTAERAADWREPPTDHFTTRYEQKRLGDCAPTFLQFRRI